MSLTVEPVLSGKDLHAFVTFPWKLYEDDPLWVPPLISDVKKIFNPKKHPFHEHGEIKPFLARRDGRIVGRIAAIRNTAHESFHDEKVGFFGFFECEDDREAALALFGAVKEFLRERGLPRFRGPMNPSTNEECGFPVEGLEHPPTVMMPHGRRYYDELLKSCGFVKAKDLIAYDLHGERGIPERLAQGAALAARRNPDLVVRPIDMKRFDEEVEKFRVVYNSAWEKNWGFVPMTDAEISHMAKELKPVVDPGLVMIAEVAGKPVGFSLALPDVNIALKHANGRLFPFGLLKLLWYKRKINRVRVMVLGVIKEYRRNGIDVIMYRDYFKYGLAKGYHSGELSWILEDNMAIRRPLEAFGSTIYKVYRIYESPVDD